MDKWVYTVLSFCLVLFVPSFLQIQSQPININNETCITPSDDKGVCINIKLCPLLQSLFENEKDNESVSSLLKNSFCGYQNEYPKVCCPLEDGGILFKNLDYDIPETPLTDQVDSILSEYNKTAVPPANLPPPNECGTNNITITRIKGGLNANLGALPWMVALGYRYLRKSNPNNKYIWRCGGALISDRYVLTAAHCTDNNKLEIVRLGDLDLDPNVNDGAEPINIPIEHVIKHEHYNRNEITNDIALLKLTNIVSFSTFIQPICLPILSEIKYKMLINVLSVVAGWGSMSFRGPTSTALLEIQIPVVDNSECTRAFSKHGILVDDHKMMCAGELEGGKDSCQGDSGSPLMWLNRGQYYLIGLVSFGFRCGEFGYPSVYTRVSNYVEWIEDKIKRNN